MIALQSSDGFKIRKDLVQKNKEGAFGLKKIFNLGVTYFYTNDIHYNKHITLKTHARIIIDGLTIRETPLPKN